MVTLFILIVGLHSARIEQFMKEFTEKFKDFYDLPSSNQQELLAEVLKSANTNPEAFKSLVYQLEFGLECQLPFTYMKH